MSANDNWRMRGGTNRREIAFVDLSAADSRLLADILPSVLEIVPVAATRSGLAQIADWLDTHGSYDTVHVISRQTLGGVQFGSDILNAAALGDVTMLDELTRIGEALTADGDVLFYVCDGAGGIHPAGNLAALMNADAPFIEEFAPQLFSVATGNAFSVVAPDSATVTATLSVPHGRGIIIVSGGGGALIAGNGGPTVQICGTAAQVNAALAAVTYTPAANANNTGLNFSAEGGNPACSTPKPGDRDG